MEAVIAGVSAIIALASLGANYFVLRRQVVIQAEQVSATLDADKSRWLGEVLTAFAEAAALVQSRSRDVYTTQAFNEKQLKLAHRFSILADLGRLYFPNLRPDRRGTHKLSAFRGARRPVLNGVILAHDVIRCLHRMDEFDDDHLLDILFDLRRVVVSEVQHSADPRRREAVLATARKVTAEQTTEARNEVTKLIKRVEALPVAKLSFDRRPNKEVDH